jgi:hypothetical protein
MPDTERYDGCKVPTSSEDTGLGIEHSVVWILLVTGPAYILMAVALRASWELRSAPAVVAVAFMAAALAGVMCSDLAWFKAQGIGILVEAERKRRRSGSSRKEKQRINYDDGRQARPVEPITQATAEDGRRTA